MISAAYVFHKATCADLKILLSEGENESSMPLLIRFRLNGYFHWIVD